VAAQLDPDAPSLPGSETIQPAVADRLLELLPALLQSLTLGLKQLPVEVTPRQLAALRALPAEGMTMSDFAELLGVSPATATYVVDRLAEVGLCDRVRREDNRRVVWVVPGTQAADLISRARHAQNTALSASLRRLTPEQMTTLLGVLDDLAQG
jgi:DNA-binding MarR family transcriptional regulator